jgi:hypothetical protein
MPTTNNNWPTPVATDLVKDGWEAIKDLGDAIDTTLGVYAPSTPGLTLINTTSFSGVTSVSAPASTFTSTYANYKILFDLTSTTTDASLSIRMRNAGSDDSGANYDTATYLYTATNIAQGLNATINGTTWVPGDIDAGTSNHSYSFSMDIFRPNEAQFTTYSAQGQTVTQAGVRASVFGGGWLKTSTQYDSITFLTSGNIAGRFSIYGYNQ